MNGVIFFIMALISGLGAYFILPIFMVVVPFLIVPALIIYKLYPKYRPRTSQSYAAPATKGFRGRIQRSFYDEFVLEFVDLNKTDRRILSKTAKAQAQRLIEKLPSDAAIKIQGKKRKKMWQITAVARSQNRDFEAQAMGFSANEAFLLLEPIMIQQIQDWHEQRDSARINSVASFKNMHDDEVAAMQDYKVLVVDDDIDSAALASAAFKRLGCRTEVATTPSQAIRHLLQHDFDIVILDWDLGGEVFASDVVTKVVNLLKTENRERNQVYRKVPKVVTYSSTHRQDLWLPNTAHFCHTDHWLKPMTLNDLQERSKMLFERPMVV